VECIIGLFSVKKDKQQGLVNSIRKAFGKIRAELEEHLDTINQNTSEIQECHELVAELDAKIDKLSERIDEIELITNPKKADCADAKLTPREQEVFMVLYMNKGLSLADFSRRLGFTQDRVNMYLLNLMSKGVPIQRALVDDVLVFSLDSDFKELQARRNILEIDPRIIQQLAVQNL
jgi:hypothetical protein